VVEMGDMDGLAKAMIQSFIAGSLMVSLLVLGAYVDSLVREKAIKKREPPKKVKCTQKVVE